MRAGGSGDSGAVGFHTAEVRSQRMLVTSTAAAEPWQWRCSGRRQKLAAERYWVLATRLAEVDSNGCHSVMTTTAVVPTARHT